MSRIRGWLNTWWLRFPEPRELSLLWAVTYAIALYIGGAALFAPPSSAFGMIDSVVYTGIGVAMIIGAVVSMVAGYRDYWGVERLGLYLQAAALFCYFVTVLALQITQPGNRWMQMGVILYALCALGARYLLIRVYTRKPTTSTIG